MVRPNDGDDSSQTADVDDTSIQEALDNPDITTINFSNDISSDLVITRPVTIDGKGNKLSGKLTVSGDNVVVKDVELTNKVVLSGNGITLQDLDINSVPTTQTSMNKEPFEKIIDISGNNITIKGSTISGNTSSGVFRNVIFVEDTAGKNITIDGNTFAALSTVYNAVEVGQAYKVGSNFVFKNNKFDAGVKHISLSMFNFDNNAKIVLENNDLKYMRISNYNNGTASITLKGGKAVLSDEELQGTADDSFVIFQQVYENESYKTLTVNVDGFKTPNGTSYTADSKGIDLFASYTSNITGEDEIPEEDKPTINYK